MNVKGKRVYIAGPMGGMPGWNLRAFERAALLIEANGGTAVSPGRIDKAVWSFDGADELPPCMERGEVLLIDILVLKTCDAIYLLAGWSKSEGAILERQWAKNLGLEVIYAPDAEQGCVGVKLEPTWEAAYIAELELECVNGYCEDDCKTILEDARRRASMTGAKPKPASSCSKCGTGKEKL